MNILLWVDERKESKSRNASFGHDILRDPTLSAFKASSGVSSVVDQNAESGSAVSLKPVVEGGLRQPAKPALPAILYVPAAHGYAYIDGAPVGVAVGNALQHLVHVQLCIHHNVLSAQL